MGCASSIQASKAKAYHSTTPAIVEAAPPATVDLPSRSFWLDLLGPCLQAKSGEIQTERAIAGKGAVALYFSAHWCPPCRGFTPKLTEWYAKSLKAKGLEVIFVSADRSASDFKGYFQEMPWLAVPFNDRERERALSKKFKVQGIPSLVILGPDGKVITKDGRAAVSNDPQGKNFPWLPKSLNEVMAGAKLLGKEGQQLGADALTGKTFALYFSAHWCPPCRGFTPKLAEWYSKSLQAKGLEVVFVSSDRDESSFKEYFDEMPWLALEYSDRKRKEELSTLFGINGIPSLVIVGPDGETITTNGRAAISADPEGHEFPWTPKPVADLKGGPGSLQETPCVLYFCEGSPAEEQKTAVEMMQPLAQSYLDKKKLDGAEEPACAFMIATQADNLSERLRDIMGLPKTDASRQLMLLDISDDGAFYEGPQGELTAEILGKFVTDFEAKVLSRKQLKTN
jgi:nucleoredoxin